MCWKDYRSRVGLKWCVGWKSFSPVSGAELVIISFGGKYSHLYLCGRTNFLKKFRQCHFSTLSISSFATSKNEEACLQYLFLLVWWQMSFRRLSERDRDWNSRTEKQKNRGTESREKIIEKQKNIKAEEQKAEEQKAGEQKAGEQKAEKKIIDKRTNGKLTNKKLNIMERIKNSEILQLIQELGLVETGESVLAEEAWKKGQPFGWPFVRTMRLELIQA